MIKENIKRNYSVLKFFDTKYSCILLHYIILYIILTVIL